jgi:hypothetical protein
VVLVNYDERTGDNNGSETQWHDPGKFWYRGLWWGNVREFDLPEGEPQPPETYSGRGDWTSNYGRVPDPDSLWWSWVLDGNRYHKEGYELWMRFAKPAISFTAISPGSEIAN